MKPTAIKIALSTLMATSLMLSPVTHASEILNDFSLKKDGSTVQYSNTHRRSLAGELNKVSRLLTDQLAQNRDMKRISNTPIAVTSIVDLENFKSTNKIGLWLTENMMHELQVRGFNVVDFKMMPAIQVTENGDFSMSKLVKELRGKHNINYVMTGTFAEHPAGVLINARIVNMENSTVVSSGQATISAAHYLRLQERLSNSKSPLKKNFVELRGVEFCTSVTPCYQPGSGCDGTQPCEENNN